VLIGAVAIHSTDVQVVGGICRVKDTRWARHNEGRVLTERVAAFPIDTGIEERERERGEGSHIFIMCMRYTIRVHPCMIL
jgi:hypothetical protein